MKKIIALFVFVSLFSCSKDDEVKTEVQEEPLDTKVILRMEDENGLTFSDIMGDFFDSGTEVAIFNTSSWQNVLIEIESFDDYLNNVAFANQIATIDSTGTSTIVLDVPALFEDGDTELIYFSVYSSIAAESTNNYVSVSMTKEETKNVTLVSAIDFTKFEN